MYRLRVLAYGALCVLGVMLWQMPRALAIDFNFSFSNTNGNVAGTVTGVIEGLTNNATGPASDILINSYPAAMTGIPAAPFSVFTFAASLPETVSLNSFTVTGGVLTNADFAVNGPIFTLNWFFFGTYYDILENPAGTTFVRNDSGFSGIAFSPVATAAPEPATIALLSSGLLGLGLVRRRR